MCAPFLYYTRTRKGEGGEGVRVLAFEIQGGVAAIFNSVWNSSFYRLVKPWQAHGTPMCPHPSPPSSLFSIPSLPPTGAVRHSSLPSLSLPLFRSRATRTNAKRTSPSPSSSSSSSLSSFLRVNTVVERRWAHFFSQPNYSPRRGAESSALPRPRSRKCQGFLSLLPLPTGEENGTEVWEYTCGILRLSIRNEPTKSSGNTRLYSF